METRESWFNRSYCTPKSDKEFDLLGDRIHWTYVNGKVYSSIAYHRQHTDDKDELSVEMFADLINDSIVPWRLKHDGFYGKASTVNPSYWSFWMCFDGVTLYVDSEGVRILPDCADGISTPLPGIKTYADLINFVKAFH